jgi:thioredoxin-related protein
MVIPSKTYSLKSAFIFLFSLVLSLNAFAQDALTTEEAFRTSVETKKPVLIIFSGSDWCASCIRFEKKVLSENSFQTFASHNLILLRADFPQRKKLPEEIKKQNEALADKYNPKGLFPHIILVIPGQSGSTTLSYNSQTPDEFISEINAHLAK